MRLQRRAIVLLTAIAVLAASALGTAGAQAAVPGNFVKHTEPNWVWFGPSNYVAVANTYGIFITGPGNTAPTIDYGGSSIFCDGNPDQHFAAQRRAFAANAQRVRFQKVSRIRNVGGTYAQTMKFTARAAGTKIMGELGFQYSSYDGQYCYSAQLYKGVKDDKRGKRSLKTLESIWSNTFYNGPGLPINPDTGLP